MAEAGIISSFFSTSCIPSWSPKSEVRHALSCQPISAPRNASTVPCCIHLVLPLTQSHALNQNTVKSRAEHCNQCLWILQPQNESQNARVRKTISRNKQQIIILVLFPNYNNLLLFSAFSLSSRRATSRQVVARLGKQSSPRRKTVKKIHDKFTVFRKKPAMFT